MRYLIAQGLLQRRMIKTPSGFKNISYTSTPNISALGGAVGKLKITEEERTLRDTNVQGEGVKNKKKHIKPLKFRI